VPWQVVENGVIQEQVSGAIRGPLVPEGVTGDGMEDEALSTAAAGTRDQEGHAVAEPLDLLGWALTLQLTDGDDLDLLAVKRREIPFQALSVEGQDLPLNVHGSVLLPAFCKERRGNAGLGEDLLAERQEF
jgi:hypothetical protein